MSAMEAICMAGLMIGILILHLTTTYEDLLHASWKNQRTKVLNLITQSVQMENTGQGSDISIESLSSTRLSTQKLGVGCIKAESV